MSDRKKSRPAGGEAHEDAASQVGVDAGLEAGSASGGAGALRFLAVGDMLPPEQATGGAAQPDVVCLSFAEVTPEALDRIRPDVVFSSLVGPGFDCLDLAEKLSAAGFRGQYRAIAPTVPNPALVRREITGSFPDLDFDLVVLAERGQPSGA